MWPGPALTAGREGALPHPALPRPLPQFPAPAPDHGSGPTPSSRFQLQLPGGRGPGKQGAQVKKFGDRWLKAYTGIAMWVRGMKNTRTARDIAPV